MCLQSFIHGLFPAHLRPQVISTMFIPIICQFYAKRSLQICNQFFGHGFNHLAHHPLLPTNHFPQYEENDTMISFTQKRYFNCSSWSNTCLSNFSYEYPAFFLSLLLLRYCGHCDFVMKGNETLFTNFCWLKPSILRFSLSQVKDWSFTSLESFIFTSLYSKVYCKHE